MCVFFLQFYPDVRSLSWEMINSGMVAKCPNILAIIDLVITFPTGSMEAERGFSRMEIINTDWRSCLLDTNLSDLLMVLLATPEVGMFDPREAIQLWNSSDTRASRPNYVADWEDISDHEEQFSDLGPTELQQMKDKANHDLVLSMMEWMTTNDMTITGIITV